MPRPRTDIEPRIVHAARALFLAHGVDGASLRKIARAANTSVGMLYYYFPTKDALFLAVVEEVYAELLADVERALAPDVPVEQRLQRVYYRVARLTDLEVEIIKLVVREMMVSSDRRDRLVERFQRGHLPLLLTTMVDGVRDGSLRDDLPPPLLMVATFGIGVVPQLIHRAIGGGTPLASLPGDEALADLLLDALLNGVRGGRDSPD